MPMNIHVSIEWMLMGGWNHQYATATTITAIMAQAIIAFFAHGREFVFHFIELFVGVEFNLRCAPAASRRLKNRPPTQTGRRRK